MTSEEPPVQLSGKSEFSDTFLNQLCSSHNTQNQSIVDIGSDASTISASLNNTLHDELVCLATSLTKSIDNATEISTPDIFFGLSLATIGAFAAWLFNHLHWKMVEASERKKAARNVMLELINDLENPALEYWLADFDPENKKTNEAKEIRLKSNLKLVVNQAKSLSELINKSSQTSTRVAIEHYAYDLFDVVTGGEFESHQKKRSKSTANKISDLCIKVKVELYKLH